MKIVHLLASPFYSGPAEVVAQLALAQRVLGHEVTVAVDRKRLFTEAEELALPRLRTLGLDADLPLELSVKSSPLGVYRDVRTVGRLDAEIVHCHFSHDHFVARWGLRKGARLVRSIHAPRSLRGVMPRADAWTIPFEALGRPLLGARVLVLPPIVPPQFVPAVDRSALRRTLGLPELPLVGMISTFQPSRRHELGMLAFAQLHARRPIARMVMMGDGALLESTRRLAKAMNLSDVISFPGYQAGDAFVRWLQALDEVWILGLGNDFSARAAAQARACGVRVLAVDEGALARYADVIVERSAEDIAAKALDPARRSVSLEDADAIARRTLELYERARA